MRKRKRLKSPEERAALRAQTESMRSPTKDRSAHDAGRGKKSTSRKNAAKVSLSELTRRELSDGELEAAIAEFHGASDRVAAVMGAALVEENLAQAITASLENADGAKALFQGMGAPLQSLKAKSLAGYALGLFNKKVERDLDTIREIRNQFAHALMSIDFSNPDIARACEKLEGHNFHIEPNRTMPRARLLYETACWSISIAMLKEAADRWMRKVEGRSLQNLVVQSWDNVFDVRSTNTTIATLIEAGLRATRDEEVKAAD